MLVGAKRHLAGLADAPNGQERIAWTSPLTEMTERVLAMRGRRVTVLATGDPMHYGIGATVAGRVTPEEVTVVPHVSSFALAAARLVWPLDRVTLLSVHGRPIERVAPHIAPDARLLILAHDGQHAESDRRDARRARLRRQPPDRARPHGRGQGIADGGARKRLVGGGAGPACARASNASPARRPSGIRASRACRTTPSSMTAS